MSGREYPQAPVAGVAAVVTHEGKVLLIRRGIAPSLNQWAFPGGVQKLGETMVACAERETREETGLSIRADQPVSALDYLERDEAGKLKFHYLIVYMGGLFLSGTLKADDDALAAAWFSREELKSIALTENTRRVLELIHFT
jgi:ADP-ribose pyrophosphatase